MYTSISRHLGFVRKVVVTIRLCTRGLGCETIQHTSTNLLTLRMAAVGPRLCAKAACSGYEWLTQHDLHTVLRTFSTKLTAKRPALSKSDLPGKRTALYATLLSCRPNDIRNLSRYRTTSNRQRRPRRHSSRRRRRCIACLCNH